MSTSRADRPRLVITSGEPAGIGPELCAQLLADAAPDCELCILGDRELLRERAVMAGVAPLPDEWIEHVPLPTRSVPGSLDVRNAPYVLELLDRALAGVHAGRFDAMVTAPVQKSVIAQSGVALSGHTEYLAERCAAPLPVMLLTCGTLRVALATTHLPLRRVADAINEDAGENGLLGEEDQNVIAPAIATARSEGIDAQGPLPADTAFVPREMARYDAYLAMYHDQGLPVLKHAAFGHAVNITLGLPIIRTSVDHGTALALAGTGNADVGSLRAAVDLARTLALQSSG